MVIFSGRTALRRKAPSTLARYVAGRAWGPIYDWGCGFGADIEYYRTQGIKAEGFDPNHRPDPLPEAGSFPVVTCAFVLNVLEPDARVELLKKIYDFLPRGGTLFLAVRTAQEIDKAKRPGWSEYSDGYLTPRQTFQKGFKPDELAALLIRAGFSSVEIARNEPLFVVARKG